MKKVKKMIVWGIGLIVAAAVVLAAVLVIRTVTYAFAEPLNGNDGPPVETSLSQRSVERFSGGIRIPTVSSAVADTVDNPFDKFKAYLPEVYPEIYKHMDTLTVNDYGLVFRWKGADPSLKPLLFLSHYDVVPVSDYDGEMVGPVVFDLGDVPLGPIEEYQTGWDYPPFSGAVAGGRVYGRGTLDMKGMRFGIMEAADALLAEGFVPQRDIYFAFGFDEEVGGLEGAVHIARYFEDQGLRFDAVYDEGGIIAAPGLGGINEAVGLVGTAEKGFCTLRIGVRGTGGHSSMPPARGSLVQAAEVIGKLNRDQMPAMLITPVASFLDNVGGAMGFASRMAIANKWLLEGALLDKMSSSPATNALVRSTTAVTMARGSDAPNVMSSLAEVTVNFRILTGQSVADVIEHVKRACEGYDVDIEVVNSREPSGISPQDTRGFRIIGESVGRLYPQARVTPYLTIGGTDAYKYQSVSDNIYRFMPVYLNEYEQRTIHNDNEYISLDDFAGMISHFKYLMRYYDK